MEQSGTIANVTRLQERSGSSSIGGRTDRLDDANDANRAGWALPRALEHLVLAAVAFVPLLAVDPGVVTSDTKTYLYLDPTRFLQQAASMWYPTVALGTVTHQTVGYLFPMGPYYAATAALHVPTWVAQRVWLGAILFAAGAGVLRLATVLALRGPGRLVAALAFMCSPYILQYSGRISVILLPWAGLPWLTACTVEALRAQHTHRTSPAPSGSWVTWHLWRTPALFALVIALTSGINATAILYVVLGPCLWLVWAVAVRREATWRDTCSVLARIGSLSLLVSAWWIAGLVVEAGYGVDILRYTESVAATSSSSTPSEALRGLGYWYFYGSGRLGPWTQSVILYTKWLWLVALSFFLPVAAFAAGIALRWRHRGYFVALTVLGVVLSVGAYPYTHPTPVGSVLKAFMNDTTAGLALRSTDRATPLALLGLAFLLGAGASALWHDMPRTGWATAVALCGMAVANNPALFNGDAAVVQGLTQPAQLPSYEVAALDHLSSVHSGTRVLAEPGDDFAAYTWGDTDDTPQPAVLTRPFVTREQQVMGSMATVDTLYAIDSPVQTSIEDWSALAPMARLLSAGNVMVEYDQDSALYGVPQAVTLAQSLATTPAGLTGPVTYGKRGQRVAKPTLDAQLLARTPHATRPSPLAVYGVTDPRPIARAESDTGAIVVAGDATGLETLAAQGLLDTTSAIYYAGTLDSDPSRLRTLAAHGATLVVTDSNRKQSFRWNGLSTNAGAIETAGDNAATTTPTSAPIDLFTGTPKGSRTIATYVGAASVTSSSYGNSVAYDPEDRAFSAIDGDLRTAWETGTFVSDADGQWWQIDFGHTVRTNHVVLVQPQFGTRKRAITRVTLTFTGSHAVNARLTATSRGRRGQRISFPERRFRTLRITIDATNKEKGTPIGFAEVRVPGQHVTEVDQLPTDLLSRLGAASLGDRLVIAMTRARVSPYTTARTDPEMTLDRAFTLPTARTFTLSGTATLSTFLADDQIDRLVGVAGSTGSGVVATSSSRLTGALADTASAAADSDPGAMWQSGFGAKDDVGAWLQYDLPSPITFDHMTLDVVADRRHSVPAEVRITASTPASGKRASRTVALPLILRSTTPGTVATVPLHFPALTGQRIRVTFTKVLKKRGTLADGARTEVLPLGIADVGIPGLRTPSVPATLPGACQSNLLRIDGRPVTVEILGPSATALADGPVSLRLCGVDRDGIHLSAGHHVVETALATTPAGTGQTCATNGGCDGWNVDELTLASAPGGGATRDAAGTPSVTPSGPSGAHTVAAPTPGAVPVMGSHETSATSWTLDVSRVRGPFEVVLGESVDSGWHAVARRGGRSVTLGAPQLVDAFANGWHVSAADLRALGVGPGHGRFVVTLVWTPQRWEWVGIAVSAVSIAACLLVVIVVRRRRRGGRARHAAGSDEGDEADEADEADEDHVPSIGFASARGPHTIQWWAIVIAAVVTSAIAAAISDPLAGAGVGVAVGAGLWLRPVRALSGVAGVGLLAAAGAMIVVSQAVHPAATGGNWPAAYHAAAGLAGAALAFFGADAVVEGLLLKARRRQGLRDGTGPPGAPSTPPPQAPQGSRGPPLPS